MKRKIQKYKNFYRGGIIYNLKDKLSREENTSSD